MIGPIAGPGQRETIKGGRDQDLLTPFWQTIFLCCCGVWILGWLAAMAIVAGPILGYTLSAAVFALRWKHRARKGWASRDGLSPRIVRLVWICSNVLMHAFIAWMLERVWTSYLMTWTTWQIMFGTAVCAVMIAPAAWTAYNIVIRIGDPNYPSPRKAVDQRQPQMPWYRDQPVAVPTELIPRLVRVQVEDNGHNYHAGVLDLPPVREWYDFVLWLLRHPDGFSEPNAKRYQVKVDLKSKRPPWYGRGFRQVRNDLFARGWAAWANESAHEQGIVLYEKALEAFHGFCEDGPPPLQESG